MWTASELIALMAARGRTPDVVVEMIARAKFAVDGDLVEVRRRSGPLTTMVSGDRLYAGHEIGAVREAATDCGQQPAARDMVRTP